MEAVGLALGALPIAIIVIKNYQKGLQSISKYKNHAKTLRDLRRHLFLQKHQLQLTLEGIGLQNPTTPELQQRLREVKPDCFEEFIGILEHMDSIISDLMDCLDVDSNGKPKWTNEPPERVCWEWRRVKRSFGGGRQKQLCAELQFWNDALKNCLGFKREIPTPFEDPLTSNCVRHFDLKSCDNTRDNLRIVHETLSAAWCNNRIHHHHPSNLELIWQLPGLKESDRLHLSVPEARGNGDTGHWQKISIDIETALVHPPSSCGGSRDTQPITQLCEIMTREAWGGHLLYTDAAGKKIIHMKRVSTPCSKFSCLPLESILSERHYKGGKGKQVDYGHLSRKERLGIAAAAAWAVLMLCDTPWLTERRLKKEDITLLVEAPAQGRGFDRPKTYPTLSYVFTSPGEASSGNPGHQRTYEDQETQIRNKTLFELGVLLIELGLDKPLHQLHRDVCNEETMRESSIRDYETAMRIINNQELELEIGDSYANAVQRCIQCHFLGAESTHNFHHLEFRKQFFIGVVAPIQATFDNIITSANASHRPGSAQARTESP